MFAQNNFLFFLCLLLPITAEARTGSFSTGTSYGMGLIMGAEGKQSTDLVTAPASYSASYGYYVGLAPTIDFGNFALKPNFTYHFLPTASGSGTDPLNSMDYKETSKTTLFNYGIAVQLNPFISADRRGRGFLSFGIGQSNAHASDSRDYLTAAGAVANTYSEKVTGSAEYVTVSTGYEFFMAKNYSMQLELGYENTKFGRTRYDSTNNVQNQSVAEGQILTNPDGSNREISISTIFAAVSFNIHFL